MEEKCIRLALGPVEVSSPVQESYNSLDRMLNNNREMRGRQLTHQITLSGSMRRPIKARIREAWHFALSTEWNSLNLALSVPNYSGPSGYQCMKAVDGKYTPSLPIQQGWTVWRNLLAWLSAKFPAISLLQMPIRYWRGVGLLKFNELIPRCIANLQKLV